MTPLTDKQSAIVEYIRHRIATGLPPTVREIGAHFAISINAVSGHLALLEKNGAIVRERGMARAIRVVDR